MRIVLILALDTCDARGGIALLRDESVLPTHPHTTAEDSSSWLLPAISRFLTPAGLTLRDIELSAAPPAPASFTGARVGPPPVKAWTGVSAPPPPASSRLEAVAAAST